MESDILDIIENALARGGYTIMDFGRKPNGDNFIVISHRNSDDNYEITVKETPK